MAGGYTTISHGFIRDTGLSPLEKLVFIYILSRSGINEGCFPGYKTMARECGVSITTVRNAARSLQRMELIKILDRYSEDGGCTSHYFIPDKDYGQYFAHI